MNNDMNEKAVFDAIKNKDWNRAFEYAKQIPPNWDIWQRLPSAAGLPDHFVRRVIDHLSNKMHTQNQNLGSFLFEMSHHLPGDASGSWPEHEPLHNDTLNSIAELSDGDPHVENAVLNHPHFSRNAKHKGLVQASDFWHSYEKSVQPHHFAVVKSMFTGHPEELNDHRGRVGSSKDYMHIIPSLLAHSKEVQQKVMNDEEIHKKMFKGEPYIKLYRGVNGHYGKLIREKAKYNPATNEVDKKNFLIPTAHLTSWTVDPKMAAQFVWGRGDIPNQPGNQGVVMSQWIPVKSVLHSGFHKTTIGQQHAHQNESEIVVGHPGGHVKVSSSAMQFQPEPEGPTHPISGEVNLHAAKNYGAAILPNLRKTEYAVETIDLFDLMTASLTDPDMIHLEKNMMKKIVPAATALALLGAPQESTQMLPLENMPAQVQQISDQKPVQSIQRMPSMSNTELKPIKMIESANATNTNHKMMTHGPHAGTSAYGSFGLMPMTIMETLNKNPTLMHKYHDFKGLDFKKDNDKIHSLMQNHPQAEVDIANAHWNRLRHVFDNDPDKMAYAWLNGVTKTMNTPDTEIKAHPYVQKYKKFKTMLDLEKRKDPDLKKSEDKEKGQFHDVKKFIPFTDVMQNYRSIKQINDAIESGQIHDLSNVGKFTHSSFVAGFDPDNSWLIKIEPHGERPGIESVRAGLQTVKETAFYYLANRIFNLGMYTPHAILGEVMDANEKTSPAVAIRMYPQVYISAADMDHNRPRSMQGILEKYRRTGDLTKLAIMLYILGEADAHGNNVLTDGSSIKLIDHGSSFGDMKFDPAHEKNVFVPYFMRAWGFKDTMSPEEKYSSMPKIDSRETEEKVKHWLMSLSKYDMVDIMKRFYIDPAPAVERLEKLQTAAAHQPVDAAINSLWTKGIEQ